jgi:hypothetical protein
VGTGLGLLGVAFFIVSVIALAAGVTWTVIKLFPLTGAKNKPAQPAAE